MNKLGASSIVQCYIEYAVIAGRITVKLRNNILCFFVKYRYIANNNEMDLFFMYDFKRSF